MSVRLECRSHLGEYTAKPNLPGDESVLLFLEVTINISVIVKDREPKKHRSKNTRSYQEVVDALPN